MGIVLTIAGYFIDYNYSRSLESTVENSAGNILKQVEIRLSDCMEASKEVSYDGVMRNAYRSFLVSGDNVELYKTANQYLYDTFSRNVLFKAVFIRFSNPAVSSNVYLINQKANSYQILQQYLTEVDPLISGAMENEDTDIRFFLCDGELYMSRNLLDSGFKTYATVSMLCDRDILFQSLLSLSPSSETFVKLDDLVLSLGDNYDIADKNAMEYSTEIDGHTFSFAVAHGDFNIWNDMPGLRTSAIFAIFSVLPILGVMILIYYLTMSKPVRTLVDATTRVQNGERGYTIKENANSKEFQALFMRFNNMSLDLKSQFETSRLEQQALQQAKIRALQSQINPHFLNNTLEVINWEARMAGDDNVSEMLDALSTMLDAALDRDGTGTASLSHEINYVDAYLHIIRKRLGDRFTVEREIDASLLDIQVPKLILQPIVENAVEHDITPRKGGRLKVCIRKEDNSIILEVIHDGVLSEADMKNIKEILSSTELGSAKKRVGLKNVAERLQLLYGGNASFAVIQNENDTISARIILPLIGPDCAIAPISNNQIQ